MANSFSLKFTRKSEEDLDEIYAYIGIQLSALTAALDIMDKIQNSITRLKDFPYCGSQVLDEPLRRKGYRKLIIENYIVFYLVDEEEKQVVIMRVIYGATDYQNVL